MTRREIEQEVYRVRNGVRTPAEDLRIRKAWLSEKEEELRYILEKLAKVKDEEVYNRFPWTESGDDSFTLYHTVKKTKNNIFVRRTLWDGSTDTHSKQNRLDRATLERGEELRTGKGWGGQYWVMGATVRKELFDRSQNLLIEIEKQKQSIQWISRCLERGEVPLSQVEHRMVDHFFSTKADLTKVDWRQGF